MILEPFDIDFIKYNQSVFCGDIENVNKIAFHGTSCKYSNQIEVHGFDCNVRPYDSKIFLEVADLVKDLNESLYTSLTQCANHPTRLSLANNSLRALEYGLKAKGGQSIGFIREAQKLISSNFPAPIAQLLSEIDNADVCVYAVSLCGLAENTIEKRGDIIWLSSSVPANQIIAKMIIPRETDYSRIKTQSGEVSLGDIYQSMSQSKK